MSQVILKMSIYGRKDKMISQMCQNCGKVMPYKRHFGWGTVIGLILTWGFWIVFMPFYPKRCPVCGDKYTGKYTTGKILLIVFISFVTFIIVSIVIIDIIKMIIY